MFNDAAFKTAFFISLLWHCLFFRIPLEGERLSKDRIIPEEISLNLEIETPVLLPKVDVLGKEKKFKPQESPAFNQGAVEPKKEPTEIIQEASPDELIQKQDAIEEIPHSESFKPKLEMPDPAQEECLRYQDMVKQRIEEYRRYPAWARKHGIEGTVAVVFIILANGEAQEIILIRSSGSKILDQEARDTIKRASPFPPIPKGVGVYSIQMDVSLVFTLH